MDRPWMPPVLLRPWQGKDSAEVLTGLLHRAFAPMARMGLDCASARQRPAATEARLARGQGFVAEVNGQLVGTLTVYGTLPHSDADAYREPGVASVHQFAVEPDWQRRGVGDALLRMAERWAQGQGCHALALDTPQQARHLLAYYLRKGYILAESLRFTGRSYQSLVLRKSIAPAIQTVKAGHPPESVHAVACKSDMRHG
ncbi:MAG: GNAT family N-acetyltransferase [Chitinimonas sp.]|nr:GNAT family N-acetyltransferase [Chitinimonas sp.]